MELGFLLLFIGIVVIVVGMILVAIEGSTSGRGFEGGAVIVIGPIPIVLASNKRIATGLLFLAIALTLILFLMHFYYRKSIIGS
ncbi:MAG: DUF131 domain-containing protein [Desulfurococcales archaeon]|nr:DUF131 domain-containing protein [Desulfurococcales archaeon]